MTYQDNEYHLGWRIMNPVSIPVLRVPYQYIRETEYNGKSVRRTPMRKVDKRFDKQYKRIYFCSWTVRFFHEWTVALTTSINNPSFVVCNVNRLTPTGCVATKYTFSELLMCAVMNTERFSLTPYSLIFASLLTAFINSLKTKKDFGKALLKWLEWYWQKALEFLAPGSFYHKGRLTLSSLWENAVSSPLVGMNNLLLCQVSLPIPFPGIFLFFSDKTV